MKLSNLPTGKPRTFITDDYIIEVYPTDGIVKFWNTGIHLGQVVKSTERPKFTLRVKKFKYYKGVYKTVLGYLAQFGGEL